MILTIILYSLAAIGIIALLLFLIWKLPKRQTKKIKDIDKKEKWKAENEYRKTILQVLGGFVVIVSLLFTWNEMTQSQKNFEKGQFTTRFAHAIKFLGETNNTIERIGGIYTLEQIAKELPENYLETLIKVLSAFVRNAPIIPKQDFKTWKIITAHIVKNVMALFKEYSLKYNLSQNIKTWLKQYGNESDELKVLYNDWVKEYYIIKPEVQIAMTVLGRIRTNRNIEFWENLPPINLSKIKLMWADLKEAYLWKADLRGADFWGADFRGAILTEANLMGADLTGAILTKAHLWGADLMETNLTEAIGLKKKQLLEVRTLYDVIGLDPEMKKDLKTEMPELFEVKSLPSNLQKDLRKKKPELFEEPKDEDEKKN